MVIYQYAIKTHSLSGSGTKVHTMMKLWVEAVTDGTHTIRAIPKDKVNDKAQYYEDRCEDPLSLVNMFSTIIKMLVNCSFEKGTMSGDKATVEAAFNFDMNCQLNYECIPAEG